MNKRTILGAFLFLSLCGCGQNASSSGVGILDTDRITANWPKFQNYQNQFSMDMSAIDRSKGPQSAQANARLATQAKYARIQGELAADVKAATRQVAQDRHLQLVVTHQFVGYGGVDITADVEKALKITETVTPSP